MVLDVKFSALASVCRYLLVALIEDPSVRPVTAAMVPGAVP